MNCCLLMVAAVSIVGINRAACRQMCLTCQYVENPKKEGIECASAPRNWTFGDTRMRCNFRCTIDAHFDKKSGDPTYFYRGCTTSNEIGEDGCHDDEVKEYCSFSCVDQDYCNHRAFRKAPGMEESGTESVHVVLWLQVVTALLVLFLGFC